MYHKIAVHKDRVMSPILTISSTMTSIPTSFSVGLCDIPIMQSAAPSEIMCQKLQYHQYRQRNNCQCSAAFKRLVYFLLHEWGETVQWHHLDPLH